MKDQTSCLDRGQDAPPPIDQAGLNSEIDAEPTTAGMCRWLPLGPM